MTPKKLYEQLEAKLGRGIPILNEYDYDKPIDRTTQILYEAICRARIEGWFPTKRQTKFFQVDIQKDTPAYMIYFKCFDLKSEDGIPTKVESTFHIEIYSSNDLIFNHEFPKSIWGDKQYVAYQFHNTLQHDEQEIIESGIYPLWKWHLVRMVADIDPIAYLGRNIWPA